MRSIQLVVFLGLTVLQQGNSNAAPGTVRISWDQCDPVVTSKCLASGAERLWIAVAARGATEPHLGYSVRLQFSNSVRTCRVYNGPPCEFSRLADAWWFDAGGCNEGRLQVATTDSEQGCSPFQGSNPIPFFRFERDLNDPILLSVDMFNAYDVVLEPQLDAWLLLFRISIDHSRSTCGDSDPDLACGHLERPAYVWIEDTEFVTPELLIKRFAIENDEVAWQADECSQDCGAVQNQSITWGRLRSLYR